MIYPSDFHLGEKQYIKIGSNWYNRNLNGIGDKILPNRLIIKKTDKSVVLNDDIIKLVETIEESDICLLPMDWHFYIKTNQTNGSDIALATANFWKKPILGRMGFMWSDFVAKENADSEETILKVIEPRLNILRSKRDEIIFKMKLTSKEEFEVLSKRIEKIEKKN